MEIVYRNLSAIKPNPKNPRKGTKEAVEKLAESIKENPKFFEARPILLSDRTGELVIIGGERRSEAAALLKMETVPTILLSGLSESQEDEILIKDNTHAGVWDEQKLQAWGKDQLQSWNVDGVKWPKQETEIKEDNFNPDKKVKSRVNPGDIWQLGDHRLMCGDSTDAEQVALLMNGEKADLVFTDPPYGNGESGKYGRGQLGIRTIMGDENLDTFKGAISVSGAEQLIYFLQWRTLAESLAFVVEMGLEINTVAVWDKKNAGLNGGGGIAEQWEAIVFAGNIKYRKFGGNVFSVAREQHKREDSPHPHQKPLVLLSDILAFVEGGKFIYDPSVVIFVVFDIPASI